jgi:hypothetical protein
MTAARAYDRRFSGSLGDVIANATVRGFFFELMQILTDLNEDVEIQNGPVDIRAEYAGKRLCRVVPYRELIHLHIGESPVWEVRVRDQAAYLDAIDRILDVYLRIASGAARPNEKFGGTSYLQR